jgi:sporulation integral membrane protein YlbJ
LWERGRILLWAALATALAGCLVAYPELAFQAADRGLRIWWFVVFPALLPFFIAGQVLMALGAVHFLGVLLEGAMRPLFNVPGVGAFVVAMGLASGYPIGAVLTARLRREGQLTEAEAERLMSFCNTADPLFMAGAVAVGMFGNPALGGSIMACHYLAALGTGLVLRFHRAGEARGPVPERPRGSLLSRAVAALVEARRRDGRPFGQVLGDAVRDSVQTLLVVGGCIILFAVVIDVLAKIGAVGAASAALAFVLRPLGIDRAAASALVSGFFEITIGTRAASQAAAPLLTRLVLCNAIIAWSGLSVFAQVATVIQGTGIRLGPYILARALQAVLAAVLTFWFWNPAWAAGGPAVPASAGPRVAAGWLLPHLAHPSFLRTLDGSVLLLGAVLLAALGAVLAAAAGRARLAGFRQARR